VIDHSTIVHVTIDLVKSDINRNL